MSRVRTPAISTTAFKPPPTTLLVEHSARPIGVPSGSGDTISLIYDLAGRMLRREYRSLANSTPLEDGFSPLTGPVADQDVFTYDAASRMLTATKGRYSNTVAFTYDAGGRRATESLAVSSMGFQPVQYSISYAYDAAGRESQLTYPDGTVVQRTFTPRSQLQAVSLTEPGSNTAQSISTFEYDAGRRETSRTYGNGITTTRTYRADNLVTAITAPSVESLTYTYDVNKNPTSEARSGVMAPYSWATDINGASGFDAQNRLTNWTRSNGDSQSWQLSAVNDWQTFTNNGVQQQRTHGPTHEIASIDNTPLQHDSRGNLTQDNRGTAMTYDADNMLAVFNANGVEGLRNATYTYDALGRRVSKTVAGATENDPPTTTLFVLSNQQVIAEYQSTGTQQPTLATRTAYGTYIDEPLILLSNLQSQICYYHSNRQYSIYNLTDATGTVLDRIAYTPYGEHYCFTPTGAPRSSISEAGNSTLYTGRSADAETGLHYFRARYFAPEIGRFLSHDPIEYPDGRNTFAAWFVPTSVDPSGKVIPLVIGGVIILSELEVAAIIAAYGMITLEACMLDPACNAAISNAVSAALTTLGAAATAIVRAACSAMNTDYHKLIKKGPCGQCNRVEGCSYAEKMTQCAKATYTIGCLSAIYTARELYVVSGCHGVFPPKVDHFRPLHDLANGIARCQVQIQRNCVLPVIF